jgi:hypothetical protein
MKKPRQVFKPLFCDIGTSKSITQFDSMRRLLLSLIAIAWTASAWAQCSSLVYDDFESGGMDPNWIQGGSYVRTFPTSGAPQGNVFLQQSGGNNSHYTGSQWNFTPSTPSYISWWSKSSTNFNNCSYMVIGDAGTSSNNGIVFCYFTSAGTVRFYNNTQNYETPTTANTWYHFEMMNINFTSKTFDLYINGSMVQGGYAFRSTSSTDISQIHLYNYDPSTQGYYDQIIIGAVPPAATAVGTDVACFGDSSGSATVSVSSGVAPFTYLWSTGDTSSTISGLGAGALTVTVTAGNGCTTTQAITISEPSAGLSGSTSSSDPTCSYTTDGSLTLTVSGGTPGYSYTWNTGDTTATLSGIGGGTYYVDYTDAAGCTGTDTFQLVAPPVLGFTDAITDILCAGQQTGAIDITPAGGTPGYIYIWSNGDTTQDISSLVGGTYAVTVTDVNGCVFTDSLTVAEPAALAASGVVTDDLGGVGSGAIDLTTTGGVAPYTFSWSNGDSTEDLTGLFPGTYIVIITDANGCVSTFSFTVDFIEAVAGMGGMDVKVWPVPFTDELQVELPADVDGGVVELWDVRGRLAHRRTVGAGERVVLDTRELAQGAYLLKVESGGKLATHRVMKQ